MLCDTLSILKWCNIYPRAQLGSPGISVIRSYDLGAISTVVISSFNCMYGWGYDWGIGNQIFRNVNSSLRLTRIICFWSDSGSCLEWYSELPDDDSSLELYSDVFDMTSIQGSGTLAGVSCSFVPQKFVPVEFRIRDAVNRMGETILAQVRCLRYDWGYCQWPLLATMELQSSKY